MGHIGITEPFAAVVADWNERGGSLLGPKTCSTDGYRVTKARDPQGAIVGLSDRPDSGQFDAVVWHELHTTDAAHAWQTYSKLMGWTATQTLDLGPSLGSYQMFAWHSADQDRGAIVNSAQNPQTHTHWLLYFTVDDIDTALIRAAQLGATVPSNPTELPHGDRVAHCEDPQGAAFALHRRGTTATDRPSTS